ncbi:MAG: hypothetical protein HQM03_08070, partial [Magnetococcales bacterium]|nr:hypothetical protein [Magnetococcales bacterium]
AQAGNAFMIADAAQEASVRGDHALEAQLRAMGMGEMTAGDDHFLSHLQARVAELANEQDEEFTGDETDHDADANRGELNVGTTLRDHNAQIHMPPVPNDDEKSQRGIAGYGVTEARGEERGMPGLTSQLNAYGPKAFHAELQDLMRTVKDAVD